MARYVALDAIDVPLRAFQTLKNQFKQKRLGPKDALSWTNLNPDASSSGFPTDLAEFFKEKTFGVTDEGLLIVSGKKTKIKIDEVETYLNGDPWNLKPPNPMELYRELGYIDNVQTTLSKILQEGAEASQKRFAQCEAVAKQLQTRATDNVAATFEAQYGTGPEGFRTFLEKNPEGGAQYITKLYDTDLAFKKMIDRVDEVRDEFGKLRKEVEDIKKEKAAGTWTNAKKAARNAVLLALLSGIGVGVKMLIDRVQQYRNEQNGCRMFHKTKGLQDKVQLLTCRDEYAEAGSDDVPLRSTCTTQAYPPASGTSIASCAPTAWNPCLANAKIRDSTGTAPLVPNVCDSYLYRKTLGPNDQVDSLQTVNACASTQKEGTCSKDYCNIETFSDTFRKQLTDDISLQCNSISFTQALIQLGKEWGKDVLCEIFGCNTNSPGSGYSWIYWLLFAIAGIGIVGTFFYKMATRRKTAARDLQQ